MLMHLRFIFEASSELNSPGEYMRYYRQLRGAEKAGIAPSIYAKWESGNRRPSRKMYLQLKTACPEI